MKGDLEYAGHAHSSKESDRRSPVISGLYSEFIYSTESMTCRYSFHIELF